MSLDLRLFLCQIISMNVVVSEDTKHNYVDNQLTVADLRKRNIGYTVLVSTVHILH